MPRPLRPLTPDVSPRPLLGALLREWRLKFEWSQHALGRRVGASGSWISRIEKAERSAPADLLQRCDLVLGTGGLLALYGAAARAHSATGSQSNGSPTSTESSPVDLTTFVVAGLRDPFPTRFRPSPTAAHLNGLGRVTERECQPGGGIQSLTLNALRAASREAASSAMDLGKLVERLFSDLLCARSEGLGDDEIASHLSILGGPVAIRAALAADSDGTAMRFLVASLIAVPHWPGVADADRLTGIAIDNEAERV